MRHINPFSVAYSLIEDSLSRCKDCDVMTRITISIARLRYDVDDIIRTTSRLSGIEERDIRSYSIREKEASVTGRTGGRRISMTERMPKAGSLFSGTQASVLLSGDTSDLEIHIKNLCRKISILKIKGVLMEFCLEDSLQENFDCDQQYEEKWDLISDGGVELQESVSDLERLGIGMIEYTSKYVYKYGQASSDDHRLKEALKVGTGQSISETGVLNAQWKMQACFILMEKAAHESERIVSRPDESKEIFETQVLCFEDFRCRIPACTLRAIYRVDWSKFGLVIKRVDIRTCNGFPSIVIEWDRPVGQIQRLDLVLHRFKDFPDQKPTWKGELKMIKSAIEAALQDLKESLPDLLSNAQDIEVRRNIPALARCISGLITSSTNADFQRECADIIGLPHADEGAMAQFIAAKLLQICAVSTSRSSVSARGGSREHA